MSVKQEKVTMQKIADTLGVSKNAVSLALSGKAGVGEELRKRILSTAIDLGYRLPSRQQEARNFLVLVPQYISGDRVFYYDIFWSIERAAGGLGCHAVMASVTPDMEENLALPGLCQTMSFAGVLPVGVFQKKYISMLAALGMPVVCVDNSYDGVMVDAVVSANIEGSCQVMQHLIDLGHRNIGYIGSTGMTASLFERWVGYSKAMHDNGIPVREEFSLTRPSPLTELLSDLEGLTAFVSSLEELPTAWFCGGDYIACSLMTVLSAKGIRVPEDVSVAAFDDIDAARVVAPGLTTVHVHREEMGTEAVKLLMRLADGVGSTAAHRKLCLRGELIVRGSTAEAEWLETERKSKAMLPALGVHHG